MGVLNDSIRSYIATCAHITIASSIHSPVSTVFTGCAAASKQFADWRLCTVQPLKQQYCEQYDTTVFAYCAGRLLAMGGLAAVASFNSDIRSVTPLGLCVVRFHASFTNVPPGELQLTSRTSGCSVGMLRAGRHSSFSGDGSRVVRLGHLMGSCFHTVITSCVADDACRRVVLATE